MLKILVLGRSGQVGWELCRTLTPLGEIAAFDSSELDVTKLDVLDNLVLSYRPQIIINAAAYTAVDQAESQPDLALKINTLAPKRLAELACQINAGLIHYSTDYVFDGKKGIPYSEEDIPYPLNTYAQTKLAGDEAIKMSGALYIIFRTSWIYSSRRENFVLKVLKWAHTKTELRIVQDQISNPTSARSLAEATAQVLGTGMKDFYDWFIEKKGIYHLAGDGYTSRYSWAQEILRLDPNKKSQTVQQVLPAKTEDFPNLATRPLFSALDSQRFEKTFGLRLPNWQVDLQLVLDEERGKS